ncbi:permease [Desulfocucumis palustris]|uniref:Permease n=1 Tax=Desulfocucumis palustris TaxID=1898651 RepID=A0A2L2XEF8_9FIRM|nr:DMT family transporter [Desulfocucumis palustris]GBF34727.1 permease [Desulfocucumis palustris]
MNQFYRGSGLIFLSAVGFGLIPVFAIYAYKGGANVTTLLFLRFIIATVFFFLYILKTNTKIILTKRQILYLFILGGILYTLQSNFYFLAVKLIPASLAVLLFYTYPVFVALLSSLAVKEMLTKHVFVSIVIASIGLTMVLGTAFNSINPAGAILAFGAALVYSAYIVLGNRVVKQLPVMVTSAFVTLFASMSFLIMGLSASGINFNLSPEAWMSIMGIALFSTILAIITFFRGIEIIGSTKASILSMIEPLVTIAFSALLFSERLTGMQVTGGLFVIFSSLYVVATERQGSVRAEKNEP